MSGDVIQATYSDWKVIKSRKVVQIAFEIPIEVADHAYALLGTPQPDKEVWCALAVLTKSRKPIGDNEAERAMKRCYALCKEPRFQAWLTTIEGWQGTTPSEEAARTILLQELGIESRRDLLSDSTAREIWAQIVVDFEREHR